MKTKLCRRRIDSNLCLQLWRNRYYGSSWFAYDNATSTGGNYILRVSGYSNFALQPLPADGAKGNITAIYTKYSSKSGGYIKYQLLVNSMNDIDF